MQIENSQIIFRKSFNYILGPSQEGIWDEQKRISRLRKEDMTDRKSINSLIRLTVTNQPDYPVGVL